VSTTLTLSGVDLVVGPRVLVRGLDLTLSDGDVTALVGPNGSGKSTLMRTVVGDLPLEGGSVRLAPAEATVAWLPQEVPDRDESLLAYARRRTGVAAADAALELAAADLADGRPGADDAYAAALERWLALGAADLDDRLPEVAATVGLDADARRPLGSLSGGQVARAALVTVLLSRHDVLLLDEPTNDLDQHGLELVTDFVGSHPGPVLIASHDRDFLDAVATSVVELDVRQQRVAHHTGGWSAHVAARDLERGRAWEAYAAYAGRRDALLDQSRRRAEWARRGRRAVARLDEPDKHLRERDRARADRQAAKGARAARAAGRLEVVAQPRKEWELRYSISEGQPPADVVATMDGAVVERGGFRLGPVTLALTRDERVAVAGANGSGKSTLLAALLGEQRLDAGRQSLGARVRLGVVDQRRVLLDTDEDVVHVTRRALGTLADTGRPWDVADVRTLLAKFGLGATHVGRPARSLSLGERTRALLAVHQGRAVNVLVLDEPTNHLDVEATEQLEAALAAYGGTLVVVTHDRRLVREVRLTTEWRVVDGRVAVTHHR
jgi:ATPase subunit of ABC transporter with duplicated ATPase domains